MYHVYTTEGFVLGDFLFSEESKYTTLFTRKFGLVTVSVQAGKSLRSKMRPHTQAFSRAEVSLVRGREVWRMVGASSIDQSFLELSLEKKSILAKVFGLLRRLIQGEGEGEDVFNILLSCSYALKRENLSSKDLLSIETLTVGKLLRSLGYLPKGVSYNDLFDLDLDIESGILPEIPGKVIADINQAIKESQL